MLSRFLLPMAVLGLFVIAFPKARADECFCLVHSKTGAILKGCERYKASTGRYATAFCTDPDTGRKSEQKMYSDWQRIEEGADRCHPCRPAKRDPYEVPRGSGDAPYIEER